MDRSLQLDLAREETTPRQALDSPLESGGSSLRSPAQNDPDSPNFTMPSHKRSSRGGMATTYQVRLKSKSPARASSASRPSRDGNVAKDELLGEGQNVVELQPMDQGFGAWSYVAATFAMFIVVWGKRCCLVAEGPLN